MEHIKNTEFECNNQCKNNYTEKTFFESFGRNDMEVKKCNSCPNMEYDNGILTCKKFN